VKQTLINFFGKYKKSTIVAIAILTITVTALASSVYTLIVATELRMKSGSFANFQGLSYFKTSDSTLFKAGATIARIDSFTTYATADTLTWLGASAGDVAIVTNVTFPYSTAVDSVRYSCIVSTNQVIVKRNSSTGSFKSGGQYAITLLSKQQ